MPNDVVPGTLLVFPISERELYRRCSQVQDYFSFEGLPLCDCCGYHKLSGGIVRVRPPLHFKHVESLSRSVSTGRETERSQP